ncbi:multidrug resistance-associated ABC transporter [Marasmius fiardii PR-910]|nr:multidrug resistance-associated ABC transporter [Marasmius fiardii PR-910]
MGNPFRPKPAPPGFGGGKQIPERKAFFLSQVIFAWLDPLMKVGFSRPLEQDDLWDLPPDRRTTALTDQVEAAFYSRCSPEQRPLAFRDRATDSESEKDLKEKGKATGETTPPEGKYDASVTKTLYSVFFARWWLAGLLQLCGDTLKTTTPLVNKVLLTWLSESYLYYRTTEEQRSALGINMSAPRGVGFGIGLAFAIFAMQEIASLLTNHQQQIAMSIGLYTRASMIGTMFRKSLRLSGKSRAEHTTGKIMTMISTDATRLDHFAIYAHTLWIAPIQMIVGIALLIDNLGYSALVGLGVLIFGLPIQGIFAVIMMQQRQKGVKITDARARLTSEVLQGIRLLKFYGWEDFYTEQISKLRKGELATIRKAAIAQSGLVACISFIPLVASILSFITYSLTGHNLTVATIFTSLQFFNIIRTPMIMLPLVLSGLSEFIVAVRRISAFLTAEELPEPPLVDFDSKDAIRVQNASFTWDAVVGLEDQLDKKGKEGDSELAKANKKEAKKKQEKKGKTPQEDSTLPTTKDDVPAPETFEGEDAAAQEPFKLKNINMTVPKGRFVAIVGQIGSGKSSILNALIGEMKKTDGEIMFGGTVGYVSQTPWIKNANVRDNITGGELDERRLDHIIKACSLERDIESLPHGLDTDIGEKGINLSGGQKARVSLARAAYTPSDIVLLDDPLSAVDSYVGKEILENCLLKGPLANRTRVLVTHALHVLDKTDYIYVVEDGALVEEGSYKHLLDHGPIFSRLINEYGRHDEADPKAGYGRKSAQDATLKGPEEKKLAEALMQEEERMTGAVTWNTYAQYLRHAGSILWAPVILFLMVLTQSSEVGNNLTLGFWTSMSIKGFDNGEYMGLYAGFGAGQAVFTYVVSYIVAILGVNASYSMFTKALRSVLRSPVSFFDTTPMGRILSRLSKDQDTLDTALPMNLVTFFFILASVFGTVGLVFYTLPLLGIMFAPTAVIYYVMAGFYRRSSVEIKRLDSLSRSKFYSSYSETLTGLATVRAYKHEAKALQDAESKLDRENQAYYLTVTMQRWLAVRLDLFSNILLLGIAIGASDNRTTLNPAKVGVVLSYALSITEVFAHLVTTFAANEQNMNAAERLLVYTTLPPEKDEKEIEPPASWPSQGSITFKNVDFAYRDGLPLVLKNVSFHIKSGEKIGVVGRTGAGKSSIIQALFRISEVTGGSIEIDGLNINSVGLQRLRTGMSLVPQDTTLFLGNLRENLDPLHTRTDAELISAMRRSWLLPSDRNGENAGDARFSLDSTVGDEGTNFSAGEKQLIALCRALVRQSNILVLDEATSSVDVETDTKLQQTIQSEFSSCTILCVAHRLNTIAHYDRVLVMDDGKVAEFDEVLNLFDNEGSIFRSLCDEASLGRADIVKIREAHSQHRAIAAAT